MHKEERRKRRKEKEREKRKEWERNSTPFNELKDSLRTALVREMKRAREDYPQLLRVVEHPHDSANPDDDATLIARYVPKNLTQIFFSVAEGGHTTGAKDFGGETMFFRDPAGMNRAIIFLRDVRSLPPATLAGANIAVFFHELGHVDDFSRGLYLIPDKAEIDIAGAEFYAHEFACLRLYENRMRVPLSFWLAAIERQMSRCGVPNVEKAAHMLMASQHYKKYRALVEPFMHCWNDTFKLPDA